MKQIIVNVGGLTIAEKQRVNEALAKITGAKQLPLFNSRAGWLFAPATTGEMMVTWSFPSETKTPTHTPQQVLEMAGMAKQGHAHAENMAQYAEDAKTTDKPWELWQIKVVSGEWHDLTGNPSFATHLGYRRKPKTKLIHGVEVPDISFTPNDGEEYVYPNIYGEDYASASRFYRGYEASEMALKAGCCYPYTEEGTQAAILHAKAMLGLAK